MVYLPGSSAAAWKLNWPLSLLTTVVVKCEPSRLALTSTPSIGPSSVEEVWPLRVLDVCACPPGGNDPVSARTVLASNRVFTRIVASLVHHLFLIGFMVALFGRLRQVP